jgi:MFS family permease
VRITVPRQKIEFLFLNIGHFLDHLFMLVFATAAALTLTRQWGISYAELIPYATPGFIAFAVCSIPAGWLAEKWSREGMMAIFFVGIGLSSMATALAQSPFQIASGLFGIGAFAAIYHLVGLSMVVQGRPKTGVPLAVNGVFGNLGVACAALITGFLIDYSGWTSAFVAPGIFSVAIGLAYIGFIVTGKRASAVAAVAGATTKTVSQQEDIPRQVLVRLFGIILVSTAMGGLIFQSTTFTLPEVFDELLKDLASSATQIGWYAFLVFTIAAFAQLVVGYLVNTHSVRTVFAFVAGLQVVFGQIPINDVLIARVAKPEYRSRVYGVRYIVTFSISASAVPVIAWIHADWGVLCFVCATRFRDDGHSRSGANAAENQRFYQNDVYLNHRAFKSKQSNRVRKDFF